MRRIVINFRISEKIEMKNSIIYIHNSILVILFILFFKLHYLA